MITMIKLKHLSRLAIVLGIMLLFVNPAHGKLIDGYGGSISSDLVIEGEELRFTGSIHNYVNQEIYVVSMNVSFTEKIAEGATREPQILNLSRHYDIDRTELSGQTTFTDSIERTIEFEPNAYLVSIFFGYSNSSQISPTTQIGYVYSLINQTVVVDGETNVARGVRIAGIVLGSIIAVIVGLIIYNAKFKKQY